ncbi:MAG: T9SS C-terminal target domain-containing protein [Cryomorphaceae bacterium]|nr:MAG: T9SS C-terminal target domain-containing protein [Cryomorphaceae bacterium]
MKPLQLFFALLFLSGTVCAQPGIWFSGQVTSHPNQAFDVILAVYSDPVVSTTLTVDENGVISPTFVELPSPQWTAAEIIFSNCQDAVVTHVIPNDTVQDMYNVFVTFDYCYNAPIPGCTDPQATNYNPVATMDDGSCTYECAFNELTLQMTGGEMLPDSANIFWLFFENNSIPIAEGPTYANQSPQTICAPDGCYMMAFGAVPFGWDGGYTLSLNGVEIVSGVLAGGQGPHTVIVESELLGCDPNSAVPGCTDPLANNYNPLATVDDGSCEYSDCAFTPLTLSMTGGATLEDSAYVYWSFSVGNSVPVAIGPHYVNDTTHAICAPDGCYFLHFGPVPEGWDGSYSLSANGVEIASGELAGGASPQSVSVFSDLLGCPPTEIPGCTDPAAYNFHPTATVDDGSCEYLDNCTLNPVQLVIATQMWASEVSWNLVLDGETILSGGGYEDYSGYVHNLCLTDGCYHLEMFDSFGDGWNGTTYTLQDSLTGEIYASGSLNAGSSGIALLPLNEECEVECGELSFEFITSPDSLLGCVVLTEAFYTGDDLSGIIEWDFGTGSPPNNWSGWTSGYQYSFNGTYTVCVTYTTDYCVLQYCDEFVASGCGGTLLGCTDPLALNYNPNATADDGSCFYADSCATNTVLFSLETELWAPEISWSLLHNGNEVASGDNYQNFMTYTEWLCLEDGCYTLVMHDSWGDGWNGAQYEITLGNEVLSAGTLDDGSFGYAEFDINTLNCEPIIAGCTDPEGDNYNPDAILDDGSCTYENCNHNELVLEISVNTTNTDTSSFAWIFGVNNSEPAEYGYFYATSGSQSYAICAPDGCYGLIFSPVDEDFEGSYTLVMNGAVISSGDFDGGQSFWNFPVELGDDVDCPTYEFPGCMDPAALNYNPYANVDDGTCQYMFGCNIYFVVSPDTTGGNTVWITPSPNIYNATELLWDFGDGNTSTDLFPIHTYSGDGPYLLCLTVTLDDPDNAGFCTVTFCAELTNEMINPPGMGAGFTINVVDPGNITGTEELANTLDMNLWPNPTRDITTVQFTLSSPDLVALELYDVSGKMLQQRSWAASAGENLLQLDLGSLPAGMYLLRLTGDQYQQSARLVKQ